MSVRVEGYLTVEEVADQLGRSVATVRRWCHDGRIGAEKAGKQWLVRSDGIPRTLRRREVRSERLGGFDLEASLRHIEAVDLREVWVPDVLRFEDHLLRADELKVAASSRIASAGPFDQVIEVEIPKTPFFARTGVLLSIEDRLAFQAAVGAISARIDRSLPACVYSARLSRDKKSFLLDGRKQWLRWMNTVAEQLRSGSPWMIKTDLAAYFDTIPHRLLIADLRALNPPPTVIPAIERMLGEWSGHRSVGIPQGPNVARLLANLYLAAVDQVMCDDGWQYSRYLDDIRIVANTRSQVIAGLRVLERECKRKGLVLSPKKTELLKGERAITDCQDQKLATAQYWWDRRHLAQAKPLLRKIWADSVAARDGIDVRNAKFSLWRLLKLRDDLPLRTLVDRLEDFAPAAQIVGPYVQPWLGRRTISDGIANFLNDPNRNTSPFLVTWLLAAALDHPRGVPNSWLPYARLLAQDRNNPTYARIIASNVLGRNRVPVDVQWIKREATAEYEPNLLRGFLVALVRAGEQDAGISKLASLRAPVLGRTVAYLRGRSSLPALVIPDAVVGVEPN